MNNMICIRYHCFSYQYRIFHKNLKYICVIIAFIYLCAFYNCFRPSSLMISVVLFKWPRLPLSHYEFVMIDGLFPCTALSTSTLLQGKHLYQGRSNFCFSLFVVNLTLKMSSKPYPILFFLMSWNSLELRVAGMGESDKLGPQN